MILHCMCIYHVCWLQVIIRSFTDSSGVPNVTDSLLQACLSSSDHPNKYSLLPANIHTSYLNCGLDLGSEFQQKFPSYIIQANYVCRTAFYTIISSYSINNNQDIASYSSHLASLLLTMVCTKG